LKRPAFQFYPGDWLRATELRACSVGARGLWIDMICLMHEGSPYGHLKVGGKVIHAANLARMVGATLSEAEGWLGELEEAGVFSRDDAGCIFSRRMVRDEEVRAARAAGGILGGNPALKKDQVKDTKKVNHPANLGPTPASAVASSSAVASANQEDKASRAGRVTLQSYIDSLKTKGERFMPDDDPLWEHAKAIDLPGEWLEMAFMVFRDRHRAGGKRYIDWRATFRNAVRENWLKLWRSADKGLQLTDAGVLAQRAYIDSKKKAA
jgi:hypothetical protein